MKTKTTKTISALLLLGSTLAFGTGNDSLYMGNVGRINPSISQILIGEVQVSCSAPLLVNVKLGEYFCYLVEC